ncbi:MAG: hypothetical protein ACOYNS_12210 [Bacteroidota bacterium]
MSNRIFLSSMMIVMSLFVRANACDFCNCLYGINPFYNDKNKIAFHYLSQHSSIAPSSVQNGTPAASFQQSGYGRNSVERIMHGTPSSTGPGLTERRQTIEFSFQQYVSERIFITALLPLTSIEITSNSSRTIMGNGDISIISRYIITDMLMDDEGFTLAAGAGIKLPAGDHSSKESDGTLLDLREQLGTGTTDGIATVLYITNVGTFTVGLDLTAKINSQDANGSRIGHSVSLNSYLSHDLYRVNSSLFALLGITGLRIEFAEKDRIKGIIDPSSGVRSIYVNIGGQLVYDVVKFNASLLIPAAQHRPSESADEGIRIYLGAQFEY